MVVYFLRSHGLSAHDEYIHTYSLHIPSLAIVWVVLQHNKDKNRVFNCLSVVLVVQGVRCAPRILGPVFFSLFISDLELGR